MEAEHEAAEALLRSIKLPEGSGGEPVGGRIVVVIGERLTVDETAWAMAQARSEGTLSYGPWRLDFALDDDPLSPIIGPLREELLRLAELLRAQGSQSRVLEIHADRAMPVGEMRRSLYAVEDAGWTPWFRVEGPEGVVALPYEFPAPPEIDGREMGWLVVHLRGDGMFLDRRAGLGGPSEYAEGLNVPKVGDKQDFLALETFMRLDREPFPVDVSGWLGAPGNAGAVDLPAVVGAPNVLAVYETLTRAPRQHPGETVALLNTDDDVPYADMIGALQMLRRFGYSVHLAGGPPDPRADAPYTPPPSDIAWDSSAQAGTPTIVGKLPREEVEAVVERNLNQIRYCYQRELRKSPGLKGKFKVKFVIDKDGSVSSSATKASTMRSPAVETCVAGRFLRFTFPKPKGDAPVTVVYPFVFRRG